MAVDANFTALCTDMQELAYTNDNYLRGLSQRVWMIPTAAAPFDPLSVPDLGAAFDRTGVNSAYSAEYSGAGENHIKAAMAANVQIGYMAMMERAFRNRHMTVTRASSHNNARKHAHGDVSNSVHLVAVRGYMEALANP